jgi:hypothetical protein
MNFIHETWVTIAHHLTNFLGISHSQPVEIHPSLVDLEMISL